MNTFHFLTPDNSKAYEAQGSQVEVPHEGPKLTLKTKYKYRQGLKNKMMAYSVFFFASVKFEICIDPKKGLIWSHFFLTMNMALQVTLLVV